MVELIFESNTLPEVDFVCDIPNRKDYQRNGTIFLCDNLERNMKMPLLISCDLNIENSHAFPVMK